MLFFCKANSSLIPRLYNGNIAGTVYFCDTLLRESLDKDRFQDAECSYAYNKGAGKKMTLPPAQNGVENRSNRAGLS